MGRRQPIILAVDLGTSSVRTALFDSTAQPIPGSSASRLYQVRYTPGHGAELDPAILLRATRAALRQTLRHAKGGPHTISGSGFWHSLLGIDAAGEPLTPIYTWADARGREDAARLRAEFDEHEIQQRTGCMLRASFWPAKLRWLQRTQPEAFPPCRHAGFPPQSGSSQKFGKQMRAVTRWPARLGFMIWRGAIGTNSFSSRAA